VAFGLLSLVVYVHDTIGYYGTIELGMYNLHCRVGLCTTVAV
jgi:hypothetical protein